MPKLVKKISGNIIDNLTGNLYCFSKLSASAQYEDYINMNQLIAYLQTFRKADYVTNLDKPMNFGLKNQYNLPIVTLEISY